MRQARSSKVGREELDDIAAHAEGAALEIGLDALVLQGDEIGDELALVEALADLDRKGHGGIGLDRADAIDAGDRGDDDDIIAFQQGAGGRVAHPVDLLVDRGFLLDIGVRAGHIGLGLVVIVIGYKVFNSIVGEEALELAVKLGRKCLVVRENDGGPLGLLDHLGHGEGLARTGDAEQHLILFVAGEALHQLLDGRGLVASGLEVGFDGKADAAFGFLRSRRAVGHPRFALKFCPSMLDQMFQSLDCCCDTCLAKTEGFSQFRVGKGDISAVKGGLWCLGKAGLRAKARFTGIEGGVQQSRQGWAKGLQFRLGGFRLGRFG